MKRNLNYFFVLFLIIVSIIFYKDFSQIDLHPQTNVSDPPPSNKTKSSKRNERFSLAIKNKDKKERFSKNKICNLLKEQEFLFNGKIKLWEHETPNDETIVMIKSEDCPSELFSYLLIDNKSGKINELIDCHNTTKEELVMHTGLQGEIKESKYVPNHLDLAISGAGFFLEKCRDKLYLLRRGNFFVSMDKVLMTTNGCTVVDQRGKSFKVLNAIDDRGCSSSQCLAIIQPQESNFKYISRNRLSFSGNIEASLISPVTIFVNHLEDIDRDAGIMGPNFDLISEFDRGTCL